MNSRVVKLTAGIGAMAALTLTAWSGLAAQQEPPKAEKPRVQVIRGESTRGVSMALKDASDKIPAPTGDAVQHFRVTSITGQKSAKGETVIVELEVQDRPFDAGPKPGK